MDGPSQSGLLGSVANDERVRRSDWQAGGIGATVRSPDLSVRPWCRAAAVSELESRLASATDTIATLTAEQTEVVRHLAVCKHRMFTCGAFCLISISFVSIRLRVSEIC